MNMDMGRVVSVFGAPNFKLLGCAPGKIGAYILSRAKSIRKAKAKLRELTSRSQGRNVCRVMENVRACLRDWSGCFEIASIDNMDAPVG